jgi:replicative DNA helicase
MYAEQLPPHDDEAEEAVLGSLLIDNDQTPHVSVMLKPDDFYKMAHAQVYESMIDIYNRGDAVNQISVADELKRTGRAADDPLGGLELLSHLIAKVPTSVYAMTYAKVVKKNSIQRQVIRFSSQVSEIGFKGEEDADGMLRRVESEWATISARPARPPALMGEALGRFLDESPRDGLKSLLRTGIDDLDCIIQGFTNEQLIILAAPTSAGKSALVKDIAMNIGETGGKILFFSVEMSERDNVARIISRKSGVNLRDVLFGPWDPKMEGKIMNAIGEVSKLPIHLASVRNPTVRTIYSEARMMQQEHGLDLVVVDYLQLRQPSSTRGTRNDQVSEISGGLKTIAGELKVPVIALSQLNRAFAQQKREPVMSDLRDSGSLEQDADIVLLLYRPELYYTEEEWEKQFPDPYPRSMAKLTVAKNRNGELGVLHLRFNAETATFLPMARDPEQREF